MALQLANMARMPHIKMTRKPKHQEVIIPNKKSSEFGAILGSEA